MKPLRNLTLALIVLISLASTALCGDMPGPTIVLPPPPTSNQSSVVIVGVEILMRILGL